MCGTLLQFFFFISRFRSFGAVVNLTMIRPPLFVSPNISSPQTSVSLFVYSRPSPRGTRWRECGLSRHLIALWELLIGGKREANNNRERTRECHSGMVFTSMGAEIYGQYFYRIHGQTYNSISPLYPNQADKDINNFMFTIMPK
jgi:hypothetical protein